jgi:hypothetical protein
MQADRIDDSPFAATREWHLSNLFSIFAMALNFDALQLSALAGAAMIKRTMASTQPDLTGGIACSFLAADWH